MAHGEQEPAGFNYGWVMVFVGFSLSAISFGGLGAVGVFLKPMAAEFGWSRGGTAMGYTMAAYAAALFGIVWGFSADRKPTRRYMLLGAIAVAGAMLLLSRTETQWQYYLFYFLFGAFGHGALVTPVWANISQWFTANKGLALGIGLAGGAFGQALVPFLARLLISAYDWRTAYLVLGLAFLVLGLAVASLTKDPPGKRVRIAAARAGQTGAESAWSLGAGRGTVIWFSIATIFCCSCMSVATIHVVPALSDNGFHPVVAASVLAILMVFGILGRLSSGKISDWIGPLPTYGLMSLGQTVLVAWFPHLDSPSGAYILAAFFGFFFSGVMSSAVICVNTMVPHEVAARSWSVVNLFAWIGMGTGSVMGGVLFDLTGDYTWSFAFAAIMGSINLLVVLAFYTSRRNQRPALATI